MEDSVKERLKIFLKDNNIKGTDFCSVIGVSTGYISSIRESIQPDKIKSIAINYPELNIAWLLTGLGEQLNKYDSKHINTVSNNKGNQNIIAGGEVHINGEMANALKDKEKQITDLHAEKNRAISEKDAYIRKIVKDAFERNEKKDSMLREKDDMLREKDTQIKMLLEQISQQTAQINKLLSMISAPKPYFSAAAEPIADYK